MRHLFSSKARVKRNEETFDNGLPTFVFKTKASIRLRIDLSFIPPNRDKTLVIEAGRAPDRIGTAWISPQDSLKVKVGDWLECYAGPITGTYEVQELPEQVGDFGSLHHLSLAIKEVSQVIA